MFSTPNLFRCLRNPLFARLYSAQIVNLIGDALTWLGLALLSFELAGEQAGVILSTALTLRVTIYVLLSPLAGAIADRVDRKRIMVVTHLARMVIVCLLPFITQPWHIYGVILGLNVFSAFFTPTYTATIPLVSSKTEYTQAIALSSATYQFLGVLGPGLAGSVAAFVGTRQVFFLDGLTFLIAAILVFTLPGQLLVSRNQEARTVRRTWEDIRAGTSCLFYDSLIRYAIFMQLVAAISGAAILVHTVGHVQSTLQLGQLEYGVVMAAFGMGAMLASVSLGSVQMTVDKTALIGPGAVLITLALLPVNWANLGGLVILWAVAGAGQTLVNVTTQTLIADRVDVEVQGSVYGAHFAWSHLWWMFSYPIAGWFGKTIAAWTFLGIGLIGLAIWIAVRFLLHPTNHHALRDGLWHDHEHSHDDHHRHSHSGKKTAARSHRHLHFHPDISSMHS